MKKIQITSGGGVWLTLYIKTETCKLYSRVFWIFLPNFIKIDPYNLLAILFQSWCVFLRHSVKTSTVNIRTEQSLTPHTTPSGSFRRQSSQPITWLILTNKTLQENTQTKGVISEGQTTQTRLCSRTIVISENCLRSNRNAFEFPELFQLPQT